MRSIIAVLFMVLTSAASAQVLKCIDKDGKVVGFASACPAGTTAQNTGIRNNSAISSAPAASQKSLAESEAEFRKRRVEEQDAAKKAEKESVQAAQRQRACDDARAYLKSLKAGQRIARTDPNTGARVFLQGQDYAKEIAVAQASVDANCK